jgi:membrane-bound lytic murein transglycosylase D
MPWSTSHPRPSRCAVLGAIAFALLVVLAVQGFQRPGRLPIDADPEEAMTGEWIDDSELARSTWEAVPAEMAARTDYWVERFLGPERATFVAYLERRSEFAPLILEELEDRDMPVELLYLAMIESGFSTGAVSPASAAGMWQFMAPTARAYGLRIDEWVDERRDPVRATRAALDYLEELYGRFGSWHLAAAAYNGGPTRVARMVRIARRHSDEELYWQVMRRLPRETREYVPRILAARRLGQDAQTFGFTADLADPYRFDRVLVPSYTRLRDVAALLDVEGSVLARLNPHLLRGMTPPGTAYMIRVPVGESGALIAALSTTRDPSSATS